MQYDLATVWEFQTGRRMWSYLEVDTSVIFHQFLSNIMELNSYIKLILIGHYQAGLFIYSGLALILSSWNYINCVR